MKYFKDSNNDVYAYDDEQLRQIARLTELEQLLSEKQPFYVDAKNKVNNTLEHLEKCKAGLATAIENESSEDEIAIFKDTVNDSTKNYEQAQIAFNEINVEYQSLQTEYNEVSPSYFEIRKNVSVMKKITVKEANAYSNPPISKEQLISEAEMQKQSCADDAEKNITILERKVRLNMATDDDKKSLNAWEIYSIKISDIDTSAAPDIQWPLKP